MAYPQARADTDLVVMVKGIIESIPLFREAFKGIPICPRSCRLTHGHVLKTSPRYFKHLGGVTQVGHLTVGFFDEPGRLASTGMTPLNRPGYHYSGTLSIHVCEAARLADAAELRNLLAHELTHALDYVLYCGDSRPHNPFFYDVAYQLNKNHGTEVALHQTLRVRHQVTKPCSRCKVCKKGERQHCPHRVVIKKRK